MVNFSGGSTGLLTRYRTLAGALMAAVVIIGIALAFVVGGNRTDRQGRVIYTHTPGLWVYLVILAVGLVAFWAIPVFGYRIPPLSPALDRKQVRANSLRIFQQTMVLRFALSESVAIISIVVLFAARSNTVLPYLLGGAIAELLMAYHVWPGSAVIARVQERLDFDGARSDLANTINGTR